METNFFSALKSGLISGKARMYGGTLQIIINLLTFEPIPEDPESGRKLERDTLVHVEGSGDRWGIPEQSPDHVISLSGPPEYATY